MDKFSQRLFLMELVTRCQACKPVLDDFNRYLMRPETHHLVFRPAREFIFQAALVSKLLWPARGSSKQSQQRARTRGGFLRTLLGVADDHAVKNRALRDHIEHYDERLDSWIEESPQRNLVKQLVGPRSAVSGSGFTDGDIIEHYDPQNKILSFRGQPFDLQLLVAGIVDIHQRAQEALVKLGRV